ncbi:MAG: NAD(P)/FAD-dependent oxidoreductase [Hyphomicrobiaceae bacterium]
MASTSTILAGIRQPLHRGEMIESDLCVIGAGSGGLSVAAGAAQMGASVVLIEKGKMGGDCLNTGCVPSKALLAAAHAAHAIRSASRFGVHGGEARVDFSRVHAHVQGVIAAIEPHDSVERFESLGITVIKAAGHFSGPDLVEAGGRKIRARRFVIATGSSPTIPPITGLADAPYFSNENIFDLDELPRHLMVIGGGPIGVEMAQSFRRLGSRVTMIERLELLARDEPEAVDVVRGALVADGISIHEKTGISRISCAGSGIEVHLQAGPSPAQIISGTHLLVAAGRTPNIAGLGLESAGVASSPRGIAVDSRLRTSNTRVFAIGDAAGGPQFTHIAGYHAGIVIRNALFGLPAKADYKSLPWVTYCDPELAHVGLTEADARKAGEATTTLITPLSDIDRAQAERNTVGLAKIVLRRNGRILGATIVAPHAGEMISMWGLAIDAGLKIGSLAQTIVPYPTLSEISKRVAGSYYTPKLFGPRTRTLVGIVQRFLP